MCKGFCQPPDPCCSELMAWENLCRSGVIGRTPCQTRWMRSSWSSSSAKHLPASIATVAWTYVGWWRPSLACLEWVTFRML